MELNNKYFLLRHGQTIYQKQNIETNYPEDASHTLSITDEGKDMIKMAAESLREKNIDLIFASPFLRTKQSAEITSEILKIENINYDDRLIDIKMGEFAGRPFEDYKNFFGDISERFEKRPAGGESWNNVIKRLRSFLDDVEKNYKGKNILVVSHGDPVWLMAGIIRGFEKDGEFLNVRKTKENNLYPKVGDLIIP